MKRRVFLKGLVGAAVLAAVLPLISPPAPRVLANIPLPDGTLSITQGSRVSMTSYIFKPNDPIMADATEELFHIEISDPMI